VCVGFANIVQQRANFIAGALSASKEKYPDLCLAQHAANISTRSQLSVNSPPEVDRRAG
jgi:hypothetical protein